MHQREHAFRQALGLSLAVHIAVFGSALAFAQSGGARLLSGIRTIHVSLVGPVGQHGTGGGTVRRERPVNLPAPAPIAVAAQATAAAPPVEPVDQGAALTEAAAGADAAVSSGHVSAGVNRGVDGADDASAGGFARGPWAELAAALERAKTYPRLARERGIEGTVVIRFHVLPSGDIDGITVVRSSGAKVLDEASVRTVQRAAPVAAGWGWIEVPMVYQLKD
jgi:TonB family protein